MREWMRVEDLSEYLQIPEKKIRHLIKQGQIPYHDKLGMPRFFKQAIDEWMMTDISKTEEPPEEDNQYIYRGRPIKSLMLTANKVLIGPTALNRLSGFIKKVVALMKEKENRNFLLRNEFEPLVNNFNDYLRLSCQLGLIDNVREGRYVHYFPTEYAQKINDEVDEGTIKEIIKECILDIIKKGKETIPQERHAVFLLWYLLKIMDKGEDPVEYHFNKGENTFFPKIRLNFTKSLCNFLFEKDREKEKEFLRKWDQYI